jgi:hypothetical protein
MMTLRLKALIHASRSRRTSSIRRWLSTASIPCAVCVCMPTLSLAATPASDAAATRAYLSASDAYALDAFAELRERVAALQARASEISGECPSALTYAPRDEAFADLSDEIVTVVVYSSAVLERSLLLREAREIGHLRWSNSKLTRLVHLEAGEENGVATIALPDVCADIAAWKANAYAVLPQSASSFLARSEAIEDESYVGPSEESRETAILRLLKPYESPADRHLAQRIERLETRTGSRFSSAITAAKAKLGDALAASVL